MLLGGMEAPLHMIGGVPSEALLLGIGLFPPLPPRSIGTPWCNALRASPIGQRKSDVQSDRAGLFASARGHENGHFLPRVCLRLWVPQVARRIWTVETKVNVQTPKKDSNHLFITSKYFKVCIK
jgi:hypothetical protein